MFDVYCPRKSCKEPFDGWTRLPHIMAIFKCQKCGKIFVQIKSKNYPVEKVIRKEFREYFTE